jgi:hypothetical protein
MSITDGEVAVTKKAKATAPRKPRVAPTAYVFHEERGFDFRKTNNPTFHSAVVYALNNALGHYTVRDMNLFYPVNILATLTDELVEQFEEHGIDTSEKEYIKFFKQITDFGALQEELVKKNMAKGVLEAGNLIYAFPKGTEVSFINSGQQQGGTIEKVTYHRSFGGNYYRFLMNVLLNISGKIREGQLAAYVGEYAGLLPVEKLPVRHISEDVKADLMARGVTFEKYALGNQFVQYTGQLTQNGWWSQKSYRADGRVMLDVASFQQIDSNKFSNEENAVGLVDDDGNSHHRRGRGNDDAMAAAEASIPLTDENRWRTYPFMWGFSFNAKQWGRIDVAGLSDIKWRPESFDKLVMDQEEKQLVRSIVEHQGGSFSDIIEGKGGGSIFLLHGPPGQGKTLTAETIAELLNRPLYAISVGELGVNPGELEETLRTILELATIWNAVLLLDEADIFLEARDEKDVVRNAMVGVFLRLLEYHQGVLFLTTNRVRNIDPAFQSRISVGLQFEVADHTKRSKIWTNLLSSAGITGVDINQLATHDLNGRNIKNVIRLSQTLSRSKGEAITTETMENVIELTSRFGREAAKAHNFGGVMRRGFFQKLKDLFDREA